MDKVEVVFKVVVRACFYALLERPFMGCEEVGWITISLGLESRTWGGMVI